jgi:hypothetical protein
MTIRKLIEAVERGRHPGDLVLTLPDQRTTDLFYKVINGTVEALSAAKALHDVLLPGWRVVDISELSSHGLRGKWLVELASWTEEKRVTVIADSEHRARLIAILRALEVEE